jgi:hypothetical protein
MTPKMLGDRCGDSFRMSHLPPRHGQQRPCQRIVATGALDRSVAAWKTEDLHQAVYCMANEVTPINKPSLIEVSWFIGFTWAYIIISVYFPVYPHPFPYWTSVKFIKKTENLIHKPWKSIIKHSHSPLQSYIHKNFIQTLNHVISIWGIHI